MPIKLGAALYHCLSAYHGRAPSALKFHPCDANTSDFADIITVFDDFSRSICRHTRQ
jgi:hypothetical protein